MIIALIEVIYWCFCLLLQNLGEIFNKERNGIRKEQKEKILGKKIMLSESKIIYPEIRLSIE